MSTEAPLYSETRPPDLPVVVWTSTSAPLAPATERTGDAAVEQLIGPDGCMDLVRLDGRIVVVGADTRARLYRGAPGAVVTGVRFDPGVLPQLLDVPAHVLVDEQAGLEDVLSAATLGRLLAGSTMPGDGTSTGAMAALAAALCAGRGSLDPLPARAARALASGHDVAGIAHDLGYSTRHLHRRALDWFGYGPKHLARILRYRRAVAHLGSGASRAEAAARAGYADASHLWRDERDLMTPPVGAAGTESRERRGAPA